MRNLLLLQLLQLGDVGVYGVLDGGGGTVGDVSLSVLRNSGRLLGGEDSRPLVDEGLGTASHQCWTLVDHGSWCVVDHGSRSTVVIADATESVAVAVADEPPQLGQTWSVLNEGGSSWHSRADGPQVVSSWCLMNHSRGSDGSAVAIGKAVGATGLDRVGGALADETGTLESSMETTLKGCSAVVAKTSNTIGERASRVDSDGGWTPLNILASYGNCTGYLVDQGGTGAGYGGCPVAGDAVSAWGLLYEGGRCGHRGGPVASHRDAWSLLNQSGWSSYGRCPVASYTNNAWGLLDVGGRSRHGGGPVASNSNATWSLMDEGGAWSGYGGGPVA